MSENEMPSEKDLAYYRAFIDGAFLANSPLLEQVYVFLQTTIGSDAWARRDSDDEEVAEFSRLLVATWEESKSKPETEDASNVVSNDEVTSDAMPWSKRRKLKNEDLVALAEEGGFTRNTLGRLRIFFEELSATEHEHNIRLWVVGGTSAAALKKIPGHPDFETWVAKWDSGPKPGSKARKLLDYMVKQLSA